MSKTISARQITTIQNAAKHATHYILEHQQEDGAIPWFNGHKLDPWDHTEALMALACMGQREAWNQGFEWLAEHQNTDGSWHAHYLGTHLPQDQTEDKTKNKIETNFVAYPATGLWHHYLCFQDKKCIAKYFPVIKAAMDFVVQHQNPDGDIQWALAGPGEPKAGSTHTIPRDALVTACSSILRSLESAICLAEVLGQECQQWRLAWLGLYDALKNKPWRFDRTWESKARYSMDWFYPILAGIYNQQEADLRLQQRWQSFVEPDIGCRCVSDEPWMTVAESSELCLALVAAGRSKQAVSILDALVRWQDDDGGFWTGYNFRDDNIWPREKTTWTAAAWILASDAAILGTSPASGLFTRCSSLI